MHVRRAGSVAAVVLAALASAGTGAADPPSARDRALAPGTRVWLDAHNCYPDRGAWTNRIERALGAGAPWIAIEQDVAWVRDSSTPARGRSVVSHDDEPRGDEPSLEEHFFARVEPLLERALAEGDRTRWPVLILHLDFKTHEPEHHEAVWELLGRYERFLTTAEKPAKDAEIAPLRLGPLLVLTESGPGQEDAFSRRVPAGGRFRLFGTVPPPPLSDEQARRMHELGPGVLIPSGATSYRRWTNLSWAAVEAGGPDEAGAWTDADLARLRALARHAHAQGLWIRFYTLNGHARTEAQGWSGSYNFGSLDAVRARWRAAIETGVEFAATDQYEAFAEELRLSGR